MANFTIDALELLEYDFTGFPSNTQPGKKCTGKGIVPEPTQTHLDTYAEKLKDLFKVKEGETQAEVTERMEADMASDAGELTGKEKSEQLLQLTADLCQNSPNARELGELPPRIRNAFMKWVYKELADPKV